MQDSNINNSVKYVVKKDNLYLTNTSDTFSNFASAKLFASRYKVGHIAAKYKGIVVPVIIKELD